MVPLRVEQQICCSADLKHRLVIVSSNAQSGEVIVKKDQPGFRI